MQRFKGFLGAVLVIACGLAIFIAQQMISKWMARRDAETYLRGLEVKNNAPKP